MRLGLIARADNTGLGVQCLEFYRHFQAQILKTLVVDVCHLSPKTLKLYPERFAKDGVLEGQIFRGFPDASILEWFLEDLDLAYCAETPYNFELFSMAAERGVKTVLHQNPEFDEYLLQPSLPRPTVFALPTRWMQDKCPDPKIVLPVPVALDRFQHLPPRTVGRHQPTSFLHVVGNPAIHDRAGTKDLLAALPHTTSEFLLTIKCQDPTYLTWDDLEFANRLDNVCLLLQTDSPENYWDLYTNDYGEPYDVMIQPRRFGGLNLPAQEALAAGMPVIMPSISPNDDLLPANWLVPATHNGRFMAKVPVDLYKVNSRDLARFIDKFADPDYRWEQQARARSCAALLSWDALKPHYHKVFEDIMAENVPCRGKTP